MLRSYATFEGAFVRAYTSHGKIQGLLAKMVASGTMRAWAKSVHAWGNAGESPALYQEPYTPMDGLAVA